MKSNLIPFQAHSFLSSQIFQGNTVIKPLTILVFLFQTLLHDTYALSLDIPYKNFSQNCKIGVLDISDFMNQKQKSNSRYIACNKKFFYSPLILQSNDNVYIEYEHISSQIGQHHEALIIINEVVKKGIVDLNSADIILVNDFCFLQQFNPQYSLTNIVQIENSKIYDNIRRSEIWQKKDGANFVFIRGYPLERMALQQFYFCVFLRKSIFVLYEWEKFFPDCVMENPYQRTVVIPYFTTQFSLKTYPANTRDILVAFVGSCAATNKKGKPGNVLRRIVFEDIQRNAETTTSQKPNLANQHSQIQVELPNSQFVNDVQIFCKCDKVPGQKRCRKSKISHKVLLHLYKNSKYCLIFSGDSYSTKRLAEVVLEGCVPVFIGKPFHALPFNQIIDYQKFGLFFELNLTKNEAILMEDVVQKQDVNGVPQYREDKYIPINQIIQVQNSSQIIDFLRKVPFEQYEQMQQYVIQQKRTFTYIPNSQNQPNSVDMILAQACQIFEQQSV